ncbi:hypothetical protein GCM10008107_19880 [Psychrosphaera saromensis]|uniref:Cadherin domain-containing protein n=1 Tax=Psychrosphaera saromensis TaxID=716813 RepID=A0A2S7USG0_9GAMM|nr:hypothetical protein [Psychrosphaera saromensis]PQJ52689.1 hypothetical protein BTO11_02825 [Psychrosphaera saromensis]GHB70485.1 hypothetical protein GCM10008107_19880 [Psychrosphaera saromensis]GLQ13173.1 hypothetical protein GCM10007917_06280 [Psychrosphaera saromensis]
MTSYKLYSTLLLSLSLTLTGCAKSGDDETVTETDGGTTTEVTTPEATLSVANPITDIELIFGTPLNFTVADNTCVDSSGADITYSMSFSNNVGFTLTNFTQLTGEATELGVVNVTATCKTDAEEVTDEFTITVVDQKVDPTVNIEALTSTTFKSGVSVALKAIAQDENVWGSIVSYEWKQTSGIAVTLSGTNTDEVTFTAPDTDDKVKLVFAVTVTDNDGATDTDTVEIFARHPLSPDVSISFPLTVGVYDKEKVDIFGNVQESTGDSLDTFVVTVDDVEHTPTITGNTWRVADVTLTDTTDINVLATSTNGLTNFDEVNLVNNDVYATTINNDIVDIAVDESTDEIYVQLSGDDPNDIKIQKFNLISSNNSTLTVTQPTEFGYTTASPTGITFDSTSGDLFVSHKVAVTKIDLETGAQSVVSDSLVGDGTDFGFITDLHYDSASDALFVADNSIGQGVEINKTTGDRTSVTFFADTSILSMTIDSTTSELYMVLNNTVGESARIYIVTSNGSSIAGQIFADSDAPLTDLALDEAGKTIYFVDATGDLIKADLANSTKTTVISNFFSVESIDDETSPMIGLHYHSGRNVIIAAGRGVDGTNKILVIDPESGDYAKVATGTVD